MPFEFKLPDLGEGVHEGEIVRWLVSEGDTVSPEQPLVEVMTDKVTAELPSPVAGKVLQLSGSPGEVVKVGSVLVTIDAGSKDGAARPQSGNGQKNAPAAKRAPAPARVEERSGVSLAVPAVRRLAKQLGVDLSSVAGSGPEGRILEADVRGAAPAREEAATPARGRRIPLRGKRRIIAEHLLEAHRNTAPYTFVEEADFTELVELRERVQPMAEQAGVRLTYLPFVLAAVSMALREHPTLNATVEAESGDLVVSEAQDLGIAVHTDDGLVVPVIRGVERRNLLDLAREVERLAEGARNGKLAREDMVGGTFSVTSLGPLGGIMATPMLNTPQVAILGVHKIAPRAVVRDGAVVPRRMANLSLTLDHRYLDGYIGARFMETLVRYIQDPALLLFWLAELRGS